MTRLLVSLIFAFTLAGHADAAKKTKTKAKPAEAAAPAPTPTPAEEAAAPAQTTTTTTTTVVTTSSNNEESSSSDHVSKWAVGGELLGAGLLYQAFGSFRPHHMIAINAGVSAFSLSVTSTTTLTSTKTSFVNFPVSASLLLGNKKHNFELLAGTLITIVSGTPSGNTGITAKATAGGVFPTFGMGYRLWPLKRGFTFRATAYALLIGGDIYPWGGASFGFAF